MEKKITLTIIELLYYGRLFFHYEKIWNLDILSIYIAKECNNQLHQRNKAIQVEASWFSKAIIQFNFQSIFNLHIFFSTEGCAIVRLLSKNLKLEYTSWV